MEALGPMSHLMPGEKLEEQLPRLVPGILALYRKPAEAYYISKVRRHTGLHVAGAGLDVGQAEGLSFGVLGQPISRFDLAVLRPPAEIRFTGCTVLAALTAVVLVPDWR